MNQYLVVFRSEEEVGFDAIAVSAHRVEGWTNDYAFFGHPQFLDEITRIYPRNIVRSVEMTHCCRDADGITLQEAKRRNAE